MTLNDAANDEVPSPCTGVCRLDAEQVCIGCRRTLAEIAAWRDASVEEKREILRRLERRGTTVRPLLCRGCGAAFSCGTGGREGRCWCMDHPPLPGPYPDAGDCLCPDCLSAAAGA